MADNTTNRKSRLVARASTIKITPANAVPVRRVDGPDTPMGQVAMKVAENGLKTQINGTRHYEFRQHPILRGVDGIIPPIFGETAEELFERMDALETAPMTAVQRCELMGLGEDDALTSAETLWRLLGDTYNANRAAAGEIGAPKPTAEILQRAMTAAQKKDWDEALHPRDAHGKFSTDGSGWINIAGHSIHIDKQPHPILKSAVMHIANFLGLTGKASDAMEHAFDKGMITNDHQLYAVAKETQKQLNNGQDQTHAVGQGLAAHGTFAVKPVAAIKSVPVWKQHHGHVNVATHDHPAVPEHVTTVAELVAFPPKATAHMIDAVNSGKVKTDTHVAELMAHAQEIKKKTAASVGVGLQHLLAGATVHEAIAGLKADPKAPIGSIGTPAAETAAPAEPAPDNFDTMPDADTTPSWPNLYADTAANKLNESGKKMYNSAQAIWTSMVSNKKITHNNAQAIIDFLAAKPSGEVLADSLIKAVHAINAAAPTTEPAAPEAPADVTIVTNEPAPAPEPPAPTALQKLEEFAKANGWNIHNHADAAAYAGISTAEANHLGKQLVDDGTLVKTDHNVYAHKDTVAAVRGTPSVKDTVEKLIHDAGRKGAGLTQNIKDTFAAATGLNTTEVGKAVHELYQAGNIVAGGSGKGWVHIDHHEPPQHGPAWDMEPPNDWDEAGETVTDPDTYADIEQFVKVNSGPGTFVTASDVNESTGISWEEADSILDQLVADNKLKYDSDNGYYHPDGVASFDANGISDPVVAPDNFDTMPEPEPAPAATPAPAQPKPLDGFDASNHMAANHNGLEMNMVAKSNWNKAVAAGTITPENQHQIIADMAKDATDDGYVSMAYSEHLESALAKQPAPTTTVDDTFGDAPAEVEERVLQYIKDHGKDAGVSGKIAQETGIPTDTVIDALVELTEKGLIKFHGDHYTTTNLKDTIEQHIKDQGPAGAGMSHDINHNLNLNMPAVAIHDELTELQNQGKVTWDGEKDSWVHTDHLTQNAYEQQALDYIHAQVAAGNTIGTDDVANGAGIPYKDADALMSKLNSEGKIHWDVDAETWMHNDHVGDEGPHGAFDKLHDKTTLAEKIEAHIKAAGPAGAGTHANLTMAMGVNPNDAADAMNELIDNEKVELVGGSWVHKSHIKEQPKTTKIITPKPMPPADAPTKDKVEAHVHSHGMAGIDSKSIAAALGIKEQAAYKNAKKLAAVGLLHNVPGVGWVHAEHVDAPGATEPTAEPGSPQAQSDKDKVEQWFAGDGKLMPTVQQLHDETGMAFSDIWTHVAQLQDEGKLAHDAHGFLYHTSGPAATTKQKVEHAMKQAGPGGLDILTGAETIAAQTGIPESHVLDALVELEQEGTLKSDNQTSVHKDHVTIVTTPSPNNFGTMPDHDKVEAYIAAHPNAPLLDIIHTTGVTATSTPVDIYQILGELGHQGKIASTTAGYTHTDPANAPVLAATAGAPSNEALPPIGMPLADMTGFNAENYLKKHYGIIKTWSDADMAFEQGVASGQITEANAPAVLKAIAENAKAKTGIHNNKPEDTDVQAAIASVLAGNAPTSPANSQTAAEAALSLDVSPVAAENYAKELGMESINDAAKGIWQDYVADGSITPQNAAQVIAAAVNDAKSGNKSFVSNFLGPIDIHAGVAIVSSATPTPSATTAKLPALTAAAAEIYAKGHGIYTTTKADELFDFAVSNGSITEDNAMAVLSAAIAMAKSNTQVGGDTINGDIMNEAIKAHGTPDPGVLNSNAAFDHNNITETNQYVKAQGMSGMLSTAEHNWSVGVNDGTITAANAGAIIAQAIANAKAESDPFVTSSHLYKAVEAVTNGTAAPTAPTQPTTGTPNNPNPLPAVVPTSLSVTHIDSYLGQYKGGGSTDMQTSGDLEIYWPNLVADGTITADNVKAILHEAVAIHKVDKPNSSYMENSSIDKAIVNLGITAGGATTAAATPAVPTAPAMPTAPFTMKTATLVMAGKTAKAQGMTNGLSDQGKKKWKYNLATGTITTANAAQILHAAITEAKAQGHTFVMAKDLVVGIDAWKAANGGATAQPAPTPATAPKTPAAAPATQTTGTPATPVAPVHPSQALLQPGTPPLASKKIAPENFATMPDKDIGEKPFKPKPGKKASSGVIMVEPDGRIWIFEPFDHSGQKKGYNGYQNTFSKGGVDSGLTAQQNAHKELYEEMGMTAEIHGHIGDFDSAESTTRFYIGTRTGGNPADAEKGLTQALKETDSVKLVTMAEAEQLLNKPRDKETLAALKAYIAANGIPTPSPIAQPKHTVTIEGGKNGPKTYDVDHMTPATDAQVDQLHADLKLSTNTQKALKAGIASGTFKTHGDLVEKVALASAAKKANGTGYDGIPSSGAYNDVTQYNGMQHLMDKADVGDAHAQKIAAAAGPHTYVSTKSAERVAAAAKVKQLQENWEKGTPDQHMHRKIGENTVGYNSGGMYEMPDGQLNYVKLQPNKAAAHNEKLAAEIYAALDKGAPQIKVIEKDGKVHIASKIINNQGHLGDFQDPDTGLYTPELAHSILKGFAADALLGNWDVLGNGKTPNSNVVIGEDGTPYRIDNGGAMLYGGAGHPKPKGALDTLTEWKTLTDPNVNGNYAKLFKSAGITSPEQIPGIGSQVQALKKLAEAHGGWEGFIKQAVPDMAPDQRKQTADLLQKRLEQMFDKVKNVPMANSLVGSLPFVYDGYSDDVEKKINQIHKNNNPAKSSKIKDFVDSFKGSSMSFNGPLVGNGQMTGEKLQQFKDLNELLKGKSAEVGFDCVVGRNIGPGHNYGGANFTEIVKNMSKLVPGTIIPNLTYQSMSTQGCNVDVSGDQVQLCIYMPKETKVVPVGVYRGSETDWEHEVILPAGYSFRVIEVFEAGKVSQSDNVPAGFRWHGTSDKTPAGKVRMVVEVVCEGVNDAELPTPPVELLNKNNQTTVVAAQKAGTYIPPPDLSGLPPDALPWMDKPKK